MIHLDDVRHQVRRSNELWHDKTREDKAAVNDEDDDYIWEQLMKIICQV